MPQPHEPATVRAPASVPATVRAPASVPATVRALGWTSFFTDLSSEAIYPLLPAFVKGLGGTGLDIGLIDGLANAVAAVVRLPSGGLSDSLGRRPLVLLGYGLSAVIRPLMAFVASPLQVLLVRAADRFGKGIRSAPRDALVTDLVEPGERGRAFGHIRAMDHAGAAIGPLVAMGFLLAFPGQERRLFLLALLPGLVTLAVIWRFVRDPPLRAARVTTTLAPGLSRPQGLLLVCVAVWAAGASSEQFLLMRAADLGVPAAFIPLVWFGLSATKSAAAHRAGRLADRWTPRVVLVCGWLTFAVAYAGLALAGQAVAAVPCMLLVAVAYGIAEPAERSLVAALSPTACQGGSFGWYALVQGLMALPAGLLAGWLWEQGSGGASTAFMVTAVLAAIAAALLGLLLASGRSQAA